MGTRRAESGVDMADEPVGRPPALAPDSQFPEEALRRSVQKFPDAKQAWPGGGDAWLYTLNLGSSADAITPWGRNVLRRDRELRDFWPTETYLAGAVASMSFRNATLDWSIEGPSTKVEQAVTDMLLAAMAGESFGWVPFIAKLLAGSVHPGQRWIHRNDTRTGGGRQLSPFKNERAPVLGIAHLDSNQCTRTGDPKYPVLYTDRDGDMHKMAWYQVICLSNYPSSIERMNGVGYCAVTRALRVAQIVRCDHGLQGREDQRAALQADALRFGSLAAEIKDETLRGQEEANNSGVGALYFAVHLASLDPEKPVSVATIDLASLPDGFNLDEEMRWYIAGLALAFGVDYQEFAPLPGGNIGSSQQSDDLAQENQRQGASGVDAHAFGGFQELWRATARLHDVFLGQRRAGRTGTPGSAHQGHGGDGHRGQHRHTLAGSGGQEPGAARHSDEEEIAGLEVVLETDVGRAQTAGGRARNQYHPRGRGPTDTSKTNLTVGDRLRKMIGR